MNEQFPKTDRDREREQERIFWEWWDKYVGDYPERFTLRMAFDAGFEAAMRERESA